MTPPFEIISKDALGRIGRLRTAHGTLETPTLLPVVNPNINTEPASLLKRVGAQGLITNAYIIYRSGELRERALADGVHGLLGFDGPVMCDSGSYQLSVYGDVEVSNREIVELQRDIGADIGVPLDIPTPPDADEERASVELEITLSRIEEALGLKGDMLLSAPVQGSTYPVLRTEAAKRARAMDADLYPIGAVVPLMEDYRYRDLVKVVTACRDGLGPAVPVHLFGAGHPAMLALAVALGCDLFDSAAYALYARDGRYLTSHGTLKLKELDELPCPCPVCSTHTAAELRHAGEGVLAEHNLHATFAELRSIRQAIRDGTLLDLLERRERSHPLLYSGVKEALAYISEHEREATIKGRSFFAFDGMSVMRPETVRFQRKMREFKVEGNVLVTSSPSAGEREGYDSVFGFSFPFGPYPPALYRTYPVGQTVLAEPVTRALVESSFRALLKFMDDNPKAIFTIELDPRFDHPLVKDVERRAEVRRLEEVSPETMMNDRYPEGDAS